MPLRWIIDHAQRLIEIIVEGESDSAAFTKLLDAIEAEGAVGYRKLLDVSGATGRMDGRDMPKIAERVSQYRNAGPFAVVAAPKGPTDGLARLFVLLAEAQDRGRVFREAQPAREWLASLGDAESRVEPIAE